MNYLQDNLVLLYSRIYSAAPNARVYVLGYPYVTPVPGTYCDPVIGISDSEMQAARNVADELNLKVSAAVQNAGSNFTFINPNLGAQPFGGHEVCTSDPYFFGLNIINQMFSFHPNQEGQAAYAWLLTNSV